MGVNRRYEIFVSHADYDRAKSGLNIEDDLPETFSEADWQKWEEPESAEQSEEAERLGQQEALKESFGEDTFPVTPARRDAYIRDWYPEDATVRVWSQQGPEDISSGIVMALKENLIHCRLDGEAGDAKVVFVAPEDEPQAREIIRQIVEGTPPE